MTEIKIYRNPACPKCAGYARIHCAMDWFHEVEISVEPTAVGLPRMGEVLVEKIATHEIYQGFDACRLICQAIPAYAPLRLLFGLRSIRENISRGMRGNHPPRNDGVIGS
jgi:hypothetical protein